MRSWGPGADGAFTLYDDAGMSFAYEKGVYNTVKLEWQDAALSRGESGHGAVVELKVALSGGKAKHITARQTAQTIKL